MLEEYLDGSTRQDGSDVDVLERWRIEVARTGTRLHSDAVALEAATFDHWFSNSAAELAEAYAPFADQMEIIAVSAPKNHLAGVARLAWSTDDNIGLSLRDMARPPFNLDPTRLVDRVGGQGRFLDILTMSAATEIQADDLSLVSACLIGAAYFEAMRRDLTWFVTIIDDYVLNYFTHAFNVPMRRVNGSPSFPYMGSPASVPCECGVAEAYEVITGPCREIMLGDPSTVNVWVSDELRSRPADVSVFP